MAEIAINTPFDTEEIKEVAIAEFKKRLDGLGPLQGSKEYVRFALQFEVKINVWRSGELGAGKETLAWGGVTKLGPADETLVAEDAAVADVYASLDPNDERLARGMPLTVETGDGKGGRMRKKVRVR